MSALTTPERPQIDASRPSEKNHALAEGWRELRRGAGTENVFVRRREIVAQGERLPKRDIVDTSFHASCAEGQGTATRTNLPTTWEKGTEQKQGAYRVRYQLGLHCTRATMDGDTKGTKWVLV